MTALIADRNTPQSLGDNRVGKAAAAVMIYAGALLIRNAAGFLLPGTTATGNIGVGRAHEQIDNTTGADGDLDVRFDPGIHRFENSAAADLITFAEIGDVAYVVDDQTVAKTDATATRSPAGIIEDVDTLGVWVRFDEALTKIAAP